MRKWRLFWLALLLLAAGLLLWWINVRDPIGSEGPLADLDGTPARAPMSSAAPAGLAVGGTAARHEEAPAESRRPPEPIQGHVRDAGTGKAIAGALVESEMVTGGGSDGRTRVRPSHTAEVRATQTDAQGHFTCRLVPGPAYRLSVAAAGYAAAYTEPTSPGATIIVELRPALRQRGHVISDRGDRVAGAKLFFRVDHPHSGVGGWRAPVVARATTDAGGNFEAALAVGVRYNLTITHAMYGTLEQWFFSAPEEAEFEMEEGVVVRGRVARASDREPLAGAWIGTHYGIRGHSGEDGSFHVSCFRDGWLFVGAEGHATQVFALRTHSGDVEAWLRPSRVLRGTVAAPDGVRLGGLALEVRGHGADGVPLERHAVMTDAGGAYRIAAAGRCHGYVVVCRAPDLQGVLAVAPPDVDDVDLGPLQLVPADEVLRGVVTGPRPPTSVVLNLVPRIEFVPGGDTHLWRMHRSLGSRVVFTDAEGRFVLAGLAAGDYELSAEAEGWPNLRVDVTVPGKAPLKLAMKGDVRIRGRLVDSEGRALAGHECFCGYGPNIATARTDAAGRFELRRSQPAEPHVLVIRSVYSRHEDSRVILRVRVKAGEGEQVFRAPGPHDIVGSVALLPGRSHHEYTVEALVDGRVVATARGDRLGFILRGIKAPLVDVRAQMTLSGRLLWEAEAPAVAPGARNLVLETR